jgi:GT2 family glycosyltransferase
MIDLSVLICSTHSRWQGFGHAIQKQVWEQYAALPEEYQDRIEILMLTDNKKMMLGHKRNVMVDAAQGCYVQFIDDDDRIEPDMFRTVLDATDSKVDVITFQVSVSMDGAQPRICRYSKDFAADVDTDEGYERIPNHLCAVRRELALQASFPNLPHGEDSAYSKLLLPHLESEYAIDRVLYHYDYSPRDTETQQHLRSPLRRRDQPAIVDVIFLSDAKNPKLQGMTQRAIVSCVAGANSLPVNVIVMEQMPGKRYMHASTLPAHAEFNYNAFANAAASKGHAEWIMVANNDLVFDDGWLHQLLAANHPVVCPRSPEDIRQKDITTNVCGYTNAVNFSGWCFMMKRSLWRQIGGFDEDFGFWCADDSVIEQLRATGIAPMLVAAAHVHHIGSVTLKTIPKAHDDMTWGFVDKFNRKYHRDKFADDERFIAWKKAHGSAQ